MKKRRYRCGGCSRILTLQELGRTTQGDICCAYCRSQDVTRHLTRVQRLCTYLLVSNFY